MSSTRQQLQTWGRRHRHIVRQSPRLNLIYRFVVGVVGAIVLVVGIVAIPYPGPGWLIVFLGLGILASEFDWAHRLLTFARGKYDAWVEWIKQRHWSVQGVLGVGTAIVVVGSLWLLGALSTAGRWVGLHQEWLASPLF